MIPPRRDTRNDKRQLDQQRQSSPAPNPAPRHRRPRGRTLAQIQDASARVAAESRHSAVAPTPRIPPASRRHRNGGPSAAAGPRRRAPSGSNTLGPRPPAPVAHVPDSDHEATDEDQEYGGQAQQHTGHAVDMEGDGAGEGARLLHRVRALILGLTGAPVLQTVERVLAALGLLVVIHSTYAGLRSLLLRLVTHSGYASIDFFNRSLGILAIHASIPHILLFNDLSVLHDANTTFSLGLDLHALDLSLDYWINYLDANGPSSRPWNHGPQALYIPDDEFLANDAFLSNALCGHIYSTPYEDLARDRIPHEGPPGESYIMDGNPSLCYMERSFKHASGNTKKLEVCDRIEQLEPRIDSNQRSLEYELRLTLHEVEMRLREFAQGLVDLGEQMMECGRSENATECPGPDLSRLVCLFHDIEEHDSWDSGSSLSKSKCYFAETFSPEMFAWNQAFNETAQALLKLVAKGPLSHLLPTGWEDPERDVRRILSKRREVFTTYINATSKSLGRARQVKEELDLSSYKEDPFPLADHHGCRAICQQRLVAVLVPFMSEIMLPRLHDMTRKTTLGLRLTQEAYSRGRSIREEMREMHGGYMFRSMHWLTQVATKNRIGQAGFVWDKRIFYDLGSLFQKVDTLFTWAWNVDSRLKSKRARAESQWRRWEDMLLGRKHGCSLGEICLWSRMSLNDSRKEPLTKDALRLADLWDCCHDCEEAWYGHRLLGDAQCINVGSGRSP